MVVNCFQKFISLIFETTHHAPCYSICTLWIAFKSLYLWYSKQRHWLYLSIKHGCELLSKVYIFDIRNNSFMWNNLRCSLWIAFKSLYLWYSKQLRCFNLLDDPGCELLSKVYIFDIRNNCCECCQARLAVVNCFQKFISLIFETTISPATAGAYQLWIAFKSLYLWYSKQHVRDFLPVEKCCELLSKVYIFDIRNNLCFLYCLLNLVVNCFQKFISLIFETTKWY